MAYIAEQCAAHMRSGTSLDASMAFLRSPSQAPVVALAWAPSGLLLASACAGSPGFVVWDVAQGISTPLAAGVSEVCTVGTTSYASSQPLQLHQLADL